MADDASTESNTASLSAVARQRLLAARGWSNLAARVAAVFVALMALWVVFALPAVEHRESTVTVTETRQDVQAGASPGVTVTNTDVTETPASDTSAFGQLLSSPGAKLLLNVGLIALAAFLAGAVVQRIWLGEFGITVGPIEIPSLPIIEPEVAQQVVGRITTAAPFDYVIRLQGEARGPQPIPQYFDIQNPRLEFLSMRIELEQLLRQLARAIGVDSELTLDRLVRRLESQQVIDHQAAQGLEQWLALGDQAAAGAEVPQETLDAFRENALHVLYALGELRREHEQRRREKPSPG